MNAAHTTASIIQAGRRAYARKWSFLVVFLVILLVAVRVVFVTGFVPNPVDFSTIGSDIASSSVSLENSPLAVGLPLSVVTGSNDTSTQTNTKTAATASVKNTNASATHSQSGSLNMNGELPVKISIASIGLSATVANPATTDVNALDQYLLSGAARYPTSATLDQEGNVILFGHSSYLPVVINHAYKTFDGIQKLKSGDEITVYSTTHVYTYAVTNVAQQSATSDAIPLTTSGHTLTLATCDSFGQKTDRFVVTATLVGSSALGS